MVKEKLKEPAKIQLGGKILTSTKNAFKVKCAKLNIPHAEALELIVKNFNKNGVPS